MRQFWKRMYFIIKFRKSIPFISDYFFSKEVQWYKKILIILLTVGYIYFPIDIIPDFIAILGIFDDVFIVGFIMERMVKWAPETLSAKYHPKKE